MVYEQLSAGDQWTVDCVVASAGGCKLDEQEQAVLRCWQRDGGGHLLPIIDERIKLQDCDDV